VKPSPDAIGLRPAEVVLEWAKRGMAEVLPGFHPGDWTVDANDVYWAAPNTQGGHGLERRKALRLGKFKQYGPDCPVICDHHWGINTPALWERCRKVSVTSALIGRSCGAA